MTKLALVKPASLVLPLPLLLLSSACVHAPPGEGSPGHATAAPPKAAAVAGRPPFFREYALDHPGSGPAILAVDEEDAVWVALAKTGKLVRFSNGAMEEFSFGLENRPVGLTIPRPGNPQHGAIWISAGLDNKLLRFDRFTHKWRVYKLAGQNTWPFNIAVAGDGDVWFTQRFAGQIGRLNPATGHIRQYTPRNKHSGPAGLTIDDRTGAVWFTQGFTDTVARLDPRTREIREWKLSDQGTGVVSGPAGIALDAAGGAWFAKLEGAIGYIAPGAAQAEIHRVPPEARRPAGIAVAPDGNVWTLALDGNLALRFDPRLRKFSSFPLPTGAPDPEPRVPPQARSARPFGIGFDRQGNLWFSEQYTGKLGVLDLAPPTIQVISPRGVVEGGRALLSLRVSDRVSGGESVSVELEGRPVATRQGFIDLMGIEPGPRRLSITATDAAGNRAQTSLTFEFQPGRYALEYAVRRLEPANPTGERLKEGLLKLVEGLGESDARDGLAEIRRELDAGKAHFKPFPLPAYLAMVDFQLRNKASLVDVRLLEEAPYFDKKEVVIRPGDAVRWRYEASGTAHSATPAKQMLKLRQEGKDLWTRTLASGDRYEYRFSSPGRFEVRRDGQPGALLAVTVQGR